jgi:hypothetical protein
MPLVFRGIEIKSVIWLLSHCSTNIRRVNVAPTKCFNSSITNSAVVEEESSGVVTPETWALVLLI